MSDTLTMKEHCQSLIDAFDRLSRLPEGDKGRCNPLTPNDPATIAMLAHRLLTVLEKIDALYVERVSLRNALRIWAYCDCRCQACKLGMLAQIKELEKL